ncbi:FG-GAP-like repeat-containing protein [Flammeovirga sp. SJP92]|uniref:Ig-like domain-containing protein n=1 Tax=Flammeovirga sp. SJP92 TaxID=1775430 RepID=UPI0007868441|nr:FG-GAP-like repeat-containing protein [Flammeovirga sp. SJP92]KXX66999.1 hypothetical protein AVL50_28920 [Flammeovirga sp. SJP92]
MNSKLLISNLLLLLITFQVNAQNFSEVTVEGLEALNNSTYISADLNGNQEKNDVIYAGINSSSTWVIGAKYISGGEWLDWSNGLEPVASPKISIGDLNKDGRMDLFVAGKDINTNSARIDVYINNGNGSWTNINSSIPQLENASIISGDFRAEGENGLLISGKNSSGEIQTRYFVYRSSNFVELDVDILGYQNAETIAFDANNDGRIDVLFSGDNPYGNRETKLYHNLGKGEYEAQAISFPALNQTKLKVADFNNDGYSDLVMTGLNASNQPSTYTYINNTGIWQQVNWGLDNIATGGLEVGDFNRDGYIDVFLNGYDRSYSRITQLYYNNAGTSFTNSTISFKEITSGDLTVLDWNNNDKLDVLLSGTTAFGTEIFLYQNDFTSAVTAPQVPTPLTPVVQVNTVKIFWNDVADAIAYDLKIGTSSGAGDVVSADAESDGTRKLFSYGKTFFEQLTIDSLAEGKYYYSIQSIGSDYKGSGFSTEDSFTICDKPDLGEDLEICLEEAVTFSAGTGNEVVTWKNMSTGEVLGSGFTLNYKVEEALSIVVEVSKPTYGCVMKDTVQINTLALPEITMPKTANSCINEKYTYTLDQTYAKVTWTSKDGTPLETTDTSFTLLLEKEEVVTLTVENEDGCTSTQDITITPYEEVDPQAPTEVFICKGEENTISLPDSWEKVVWQNLDDGSDPVESDTYTYISNVEERVQVTVTDANGCVGTDIITLKVWDLPTIDLGEDLQVCKDETITFTTDDWKTIQWKRKSDGNIIGSEMTLEWTVAQTDVLYLAVENENGCWSYDTLEIEMLELPVITLEEEYFTCFQEVTAIEAGEHTTYKWWDVNADTLMGEGKVLAYTATEDIEIKFTATNADGCELSKTIQSRVRELPAVSIGDDLNTCIDGFLTINLTTNDWASIEWGALQTSAHTATDVTQVEWDFAVDDTVWVKVIDNNGCVNTDTLKVTIWDEPDPGLSEEVFICEYETLTLEATQSWANVEWKRLSDETVVSTENTYSILITEQDTVVHTVSDGNGCVGIDTVVVKVYPRPEFDLGNDTLICYSSSIDLDVGGGYTQVEWYSKNQGKLAETSRLLNWTVTETDSVWAIATNTEGCQNVDSIYVEMAPLPTPNIGEELRACIGDVETIDGGDWKTYQWTSGQYGDLGTDKTIAYTFAVQDTIWLTVTNENNCTEYDSLIINPFALPDFTMGEDQVICYKTSAELSIGNDTWTNVKWFSKERGEIATNVNSITYTATVKDSIFTEVTNENGCIAYDTLVMGVYDLPVFETQGTKEICHLSNYQLTVDSSLDSVNWYVLGENSPFVENQRFITAQMTETITYVVEAFNVERCVWYDTVEVKQLALPEFSLGADQSICYNTEVVIEVDREIESVDYIHWYSTFEGKLDNDDNTSFTQEVFNDETIWVEIGNTNGCIYRDTVEVKVLELPTFELGETQQICYLESTTFEVGISSDIVKWSSHLLGEIKEGNEYTHSVYETDTIYVERTNELGCIWKDTVTVEMLELPDFQIPETYEICFDQEGTIKVEGDWSKVEWLDINHNTYAEDGTSYTFTADESHTIVAKVTSWQGCVSYDTTEIEVLELPIAKAGEDKVICTADIVQIGENESNADWTYNWFPSEGLSDASIATPNASPQSTTTYYLQITNDKGCVSLLDSVTVTVNEFYSVNAGPDVEICIGESVEIGGYPIVDGGEHNYSFEWNNAATLDDANASHPLAFPTETTEYIVTAKLGDCLEYQDTVTVTVHKLPEITISEDVSIGYKGEVTLEASGGKYYLWAPDYEINSPSISSPTVSPKVTTTYTVQVMTENGCVDTKSMTVFVGNEVFVPNLFTPNDDGKNDTFHVYGKGIKELELKVMDHAGKTVYYSDNYKDINEKGWDGKLNGADLPNGTYLWKIAGIYEDGTEVKYNGTTHGTINLKR